jgi:hypothetical protein
MIDMLNEIRDLLRFMKKNTLAVGIISFTEAIVTTITATASQHLTIAGATGKDIIFTLTDAAGARKIIVYDSGAVDVFDIDSNGKATAAGGFVGDLIGDVIGDLAAATGAHLTIANAANNKNIVLNLGDDAGATKVSITDSGDAEIASINSNGEINGSAMLAPLKYAAVETSGAPTNAECVSAFGAAATVGSGFVGVLQDSGADGVSYLCVSNGTNYDVFTGVAGA